MSAGSTPPPTAASPAAGWYPDGDDARSLRWWDGAGWTEHRQQPDAPARPGSVRSLAGLPLAVKVATVGALVAALGMFLPRLALPPGVLLAEGNSFVQSGKLALLIFPVALLAIERAWRRREEVGVNGSLIGCGLFIAVSAIWFGTNVELRPRGVAALAPSVSPEPGIGVYVVVAGAALIFIAGFLGRPTAAGADSAEISA